MSLLQAVTSFSFFFPFFTEGTCEAITVPLCQDIDYNMTSLPNLLGQTSQEDAALEVHQFFPLVQVNCSPYLKRFLCAMYTPKCSPNQAQHKPCRSLCENAKAGCLPIMETFGFSWPDSLDCNDLSEEEGCYTGEIGNPVFDCHLAKFLFSVDKFVWHQIDTHQ